MTYSIAIVSSCGSFGDTLYSCSMFDFSATTNSVTKVVHGAFLETVCPLEY